MSARCDCDEHHVEDCPVGESEMAYWARYFGQTNDRTREERRACLERMRPHGVTAGLDNAEVG